MKVATMVRGILPVPRPSDIMYSPLDVAVAISEGLTNRGHKVTYFGPEGTRLHVSEVRTGGLRPLVHNNNELQAVIGTADLFMNYIPSLYDHYLAEDMFKRARAGEYDLLHFHHPESVLSLTKLFPDVPVAFTLHDQLDSVRREVIQMYASPNQHYISISNSQRRLAPDLPYAATVYNGVDTGLFKHNGPAEDYLLFVGRIVPDKGVKEAVQLAIQTNSKLLIIGQTLATDQWYFDAHIKPYLSDRILYLGLIEHRQLVRYYQKARALIMAIQWEEPFGLTMVESMACGTPVIAMNRGSVPEIIVDGKTGFIASSLNEMVEALQKIDIIDRKDCQAHVKAHFSTKRMVENYEMVFGQIIARSKPHRLPKGITHTVRKAAQPLSSRIKRVHRSVAAVGKKTSAPKAKAQK